MLVEKHNIKYGDLPFHIELYSVTNEQPHYHENTLEIMLCLEGDIEVTSSTEHDPFEAGDILSFDPADIHFLNGDGNNIIASFYFDLTSPVYQNDELLKLSFNCNKKIPGQQDQIDLLLNNLKSELLTLLAAYLFPEIVPVHNEKSTTTLAQSIVNNMVNNFIYVAVDNDIKDYSDDFKNRFKIITEYIHGHYQEKITLQHLSQLAHVDANYLSQTFKAIDSDGFKGYLYKIRVYHSEHLLLERPELKIPDISYMCGFSDPKLYHREFKKAYEGLTPHKHLQRYREYKKTVEPNKYHDSDSLPEDFKLLLLKNFLSIHY